MNLFHNQWLYIIVLAIITFSVVLNGYLRGSMKAQIDAVLGFLLVVILSLVFVFLGWKIGLVFVISAFIFGVIIRPFTQVIAKKLLGR